MNQEMKKQIEELVSDREKFDAFVYTPLDEAIEELNRRREDKELLAKIGVSLPAPFLIKITEGPHAALLVHLTTPNHEISRFTNIVDAISNMEPLFCEYVDDKFTDNNPWKYILGKMTFYRGREEGGGRKTETLRVIDFDKFRGHKISEIMTLWGQSLVDFHHELFNEIYEGKIPVNSFLDFSEWYSKCGGRPKMYYEHMLKIFLRDAILFENFHLDSKEIAFTKEIFLPALLKVRNEFGYKPLIVALEPTEIEGKEFWTHYPEVLLDYVKEKFDNVIK